MDYKDVLAIVILIVVLVVSFKFYPNSKLGVLTNYINSFFTGKSK
ncbi:hypothetical protein [Clostridium manihotivorum]|nr:hypothetical protein [Clostridium manihotivorum]